MKEVLVEAFSKKRSVKFVSEGEELSKLKETTIERFVDKGLNAECALSFEIASTVWPGQWIEVLDGDEIPDKSFLRVSVDEVSSCIFSVLIYFMLSLSIQTSKTEDVCLNIQEDNSSDLSLPPVISQARLNVRGGQWTLQKQVCCAH